MNATGYRWALWAGLLPIVAVNAAYLINIWQGSEACFPYLQGCQSVSRGLRSGPGLWLFKLFAVPSAAAMVMAWYGTHQFLQRVAIGSAARRRAVWWLGLVGAVFFLVYAAWLGTEGEFYRWLRRYGVVFYFAGTGLAHLLVMVLIRNEWRDVKDLHRLARPYIGVVSVTWILGVASAFKRQLVDDPAFIDRLENALEWNFSLALALAFVALAPLLGTAAVKH